MRRQRESVGGETVRERRWGDSESVGDKEITRVSERPIAVKKSLRRRERRV